MIRLFHLSTRAAIVAASMLICFAMAANAAMVEQTIKQMADNSTDIVSARVVSVGSFWNEDKTFIFTSVTLDVKSPIKGNLAATSQIEVLVPGGVVDGTGLRVEHAPEFETGQDVIAFLSPQPQNRYRVTAWEQGKFTVESGTVVKRNVSEAAFINEIKQAMK
ncbi:MAG: hypothetical protein ACE5FH_06795 [Candidatus Zixiibacteriota bacterium]